MQMTQEKTLLQYIDFQLVENWSVQYLKWTAFSYNKDFQLVSIWDFLTRNKSSIDIQDNIEYKRVTIKINNWWVYLRDMEIWKNIGTKKQFIVSKWQFLLSKIDARNGAFWVIPEEVDGAIITWNFWTFDVDYSKINPHFLSLIVTTPEFILFAEHASNGTTNRHYLQEDAFLKVKIPLPSLADQDRIVAAYYKNITESKQALERAEKLEWEIERYLMEELGIEKLEKSKEKIDILRFIDFKKVFEWWIDKIGWLKLIQSHRFEVINLEEDSSLYHEIKRWKSPIYSQKWSWLILNQKCNRWDEIDLQYAKIVDSTWLSTVDKNILTKEWDVLINSTWEWTIGRASSVREWYEWLLYDSHLLMLRTNQLKLNSKFFVIYFNSVFWQEQVNQIKSAQATNQTELWVWNLSKIYFPLPPLEIQEKIVTHIGVMKDEIQRLRQSAEELRESAGRVFEEEIFS